MNEVIDDYPDQEIHVILDNLNTPKPTHDGWLARPKKMCAFTARQPTPPG